MIKKGWYILLFCLTGLYSFGQHQITEGEYFWDADPGSGNGTPLLAYDGSFNTSLEELFKNGIDVSALAQGAHTFNVRVKGNDGNWGSVFRQTIYLEGTPLTISRSANIVQGEYFWDTDPGTGSGTPLLAFDGSFNTAIEELFKNGIDVSSLAQGAHSFSVRVKGNDGSWGSTFRQTIYLEGTPLTISRSVNIVQGEYFWDTDPGTGSGTPLLAFDGSFNTAIEELFKNGIDVSSLAQGAHSFSVRVKGNDGSWGSTFRQTIYLEGIPLTISRTVNILQGEYFWDTDPGTGSGTPLLAFDGSFNTAIEELFKNGIDISALTQGAHSFNVRVRGNDGNWSTPFQQAIYLEGVPLSITRNVKVIQGEYFWDTDPGTGSGTPLLAFDGSFNTAIEELFKNGINTTGLAAGPHSIQTRIKGEDGVWSNVFRQTIYVECVTPTAPTIAITASNNNFCQGTPVTFSATITNGGTGPIYQWIKNGASVGNNSPTYTDATLMNNDVVTCNLVSNSICASPVTASGNSITMVVTPSTNPSITINSSSTTICSGSSVTFTATPTNGGSTPTYQWYLNGAATGTNAVTYTSTTLLNGDVISCELTSNASCLSSTTATSSSITMTVNPIVTPTITIASNTGTTICNGTSVTFNSTITNGGSTPLYQWKRNGVNVGTNTASYTTSTLGNGDVITCELTSNAFCMSSANATSNSVTMTVQPNVTSSVSIISDQGTSICAGTTVVFTATPVNGGSSPTYQWKQNGTNVGTNTASYTLSSLANGDVITCELTSSIACASPNSATSNIITMIVTPVTTPTIVVTANPGSTVCQGSTVTFTATITNGGSSPVYQWKRNGTNVGTNSTTYSSSSLVSGDVITCELTSNASCATTSTATSTPLTMTVNPMTDPTVMISSSATTICNGSLVTYTAAITNGGSTPVYQWQKNGVNVGTNSATYNVATLADGDVITCILTSNAACVNSTTATSNAITMMVQPVVVPTVTISSAQGAFICDGTTVVFTATITDGGSTPTHQWKKNGVNVGTNSATYSDAALVNGDIIICELTSNATCATPAVVNSAAITMTVQSTVAPTITISSDVGTAICPGTTAVYTAVITNGGSAPVYQWKKNGTNVGTSSATYSDASLNDGDVITCELTSNAPCVTTNSGVSNALTMDVNPIVVPTIILNSDLSFPICPGETVNFSAAITNGGGSPDYVWLRNGISVGTNAPTYSASDLNNGDLITCTLQSDAVCASPSAVTSNAITASVVAIDLTTTVNGAEIAANQNGATYQWYDCSINAPIVGATQQSYTPTVTGNYAVEVTFGNCSELSDCVFIDFTGVEEESSDVLSFYPNPTMDYFKVDISSSEVFALSIYDVTGRLVLEKITVQPSELIDVRQLASGAYQVYVRRADHFSSGKIVINK